MTPGTTAEGIVGRDDDRVVAVSALSGEGLERLRDTMAEVLADLWLEIDLSLPYAAGELLSRVRERGMVEFEYREQDVGVRGKVPPSLATELRQAAGAEPEADRE